MHIGMKISSAAKERFLADLRRSMEDKHWSQTGLARRCGLNQSQVSRICAGRFVSFSSSIMQICMTLGLSTDSYIADRSPDERARILEVAIELWDGTADGAKRVTALLREIAAFSRAKR
jgi:transcriptional regulator with XRE-family HTH domain